MVKKNSALPAFVWEAKNSRAMRHSVVYISVLPSIRSFLLKRGFFGLSAGTFSVFSKTLSKNLFFFLLAKHFFLLLPHPRLLALATMGSPTSKRQPKSYVDSDDEKDDGKSTSSDDYTPEHLRDNEPNTTTHIQEYSAEETKDVCTWKFLVIMLLLVAGGFSAATCTSFVRTTQRDDYQQVYQQTSHQVAQGLQRRYDTLVQSMTTQAQWMVAQYSLDGYMRPLAMLSTFNITAQNILSIPGVNSVQWTTATNLSEPESSLEALFDAVNTTRATLMTTSVPDEDAESNAYMMTPIVRADTALLGALYVDISWQGIFSHFLAEDNENTVEMIAVLRSSCPVDPLQSYLIRPTNVEYLGLGDWHNTDFDDQHVFAPFYNFADEDSITSVTGHCFYSVHMYPTDALAASYQDDLPVYVLWAVIVLFVAVTAAFGVYDYFVSKRQRKVMHAATRSEQLVASVFPATIRDRLMQEDLRKSGTNQKGRLKNLMHNGLDNATGDDVLSSKPIADLFPEVTILFADISGYV
jgi:hypothetical protein